MAWENLVETTLKAFEEKGVCSLETTEGEELLNAHRMLEHLSCSSYPSLIKQGVCISLASSAYKLYQIYKEEENAEARNSA